MAGTTPLVASGIALAATDALALDPSDDGPLVVDRVGPIWQTLNPDLYSLLPAVLRSGTSALRDAWLQTWGQAALTAQARAGFVLEAQWSPRFAEGIWLDAWGKTLGHPRLPGELDAPFRARLLGGFDVVSPAAVKAQVNAVVATANIPSVIYMEPAVDAAYCGPATTSDPIDINSRQQTIGTLQTWFAFTQPQIPLSGVVGINQTIYYAQNLRFWANYSGLTGNAKIGAFSVPLGAGFWVIAQAPLGDDSLSPHSEPISFSVATPGTVGLDLQDFAQGITGQTTPNQSVVNGTPSWTSISYGYVPAAYSQLIDTIISEVNRHKGGGVPWVAMIDYAPQYQR